MSFRLAGFSGSGYDKGRGVLWQAAWVVTSSLIVRRTWCPSVLRVSLLRLFGARIGRGVLIREHVRIHWPWKLRIGDDVWIGVDAWLLNLEPISIGSNVCISQSAFLCTGSHDYRSPTFEFDNQPISVEDGVWIATRATVLRGVKIGADSIIGATAVVRKDVAPNSIVLAPSSTVVPRERRES
ncbi:putative colanic acid biosynthesis acetyltransferase WcaF [Microbacteriaceae bacterium SG_E_30_P1]|uniref:Colanic acid biosynthesis acetyltransferase WcaF n=1 Tax=Antiquaquibacter oligotrophicus TaxID=2880260 RepID=A0ABT6KRN6_9MICO|nr:WcaF family extracellular polysaccharide biosynthesis acetyltransferase [Antiquaquibacter oligotrophicus]MDH6181869.1 putative colanic acid biosynthesis acetyltransferase WcaF [Antiquaquibacter oligotrophicus]UDF12455.1 WcaF family extracellular polysaccharide biosynthesis acetyltransferase [Antiquaquibacter oligotrophicus]